MKLQTEIYTLQTILALLGMVSISIGLSGIWMGPNNMNTVNVPMRLDNHYRYLSGVVLGFGLTIWFYVIPRITQVTNIVRIFVLMVFLGGIARIIGLLKNGMFLDPFTIVAVITELIGAPILCFWQARVARRKDKAT